MQNDYDVVIVGGGPAGSTCGSLLRKYDRGLSVLILEREKFPREHVGESQLPPINAILEEMGCWDKVERANFPIKLGATYRWGNTDDLWDFELYPAKLFRDERRPARFEGQRKLTSFQVDRPIYDKILLDHAAQLGCEVREEAKVVRVETEGDRVLGLEMEGGERIRAKHYIDCSGGSGIVRRALNIGIEEPSELRNVAFWDYWTDAEWAITIGKGGTRVQVMSLGYGWIWCIPISPDRTSIGLVVPAEYYKASGKRPQELYDAAVREDRVIAKLIEKATPDGNLRTTKDWSFVADRMAGENWFLAGESGGFADPILAAGMTLAHVAAQEAAYTILERNRGKLDPVWLGEQYTERQRIRVLQHIRFADFWYTANGCFTDLKAYTSEIARDAGLDLKADDAFQWLGTGGFVNETTTSGLAGFPLGAVRDTVQVILHEKPELEVSKYNRFHLDLEGATKEPFAMYSNGRIKTAERYVRDGKTLPIFDFFHLLILVLSKYKDLRTVMATLVHELVKSKRAKDPAHAMEIGISYLEAMMRDGWVRGEQVPGNGELTYDLPSLAMNIHFNEDAVVR
ncbi:NAD(P)/FAD-dependent oxidoreductase [bacterium]|nr:MAG: NAD(P)/FAD-dependent oxidoreductase [bacterium]